jgi:hypothetical protein
MRLKAEAISYRHMLQKLGERIQRDFRLKLRLGCSDIIK